MKLAGRDNMSDGARPALRGAFTLVETLVSILIMTLLLVLLLPALSNSIAAARGFQCSLSQRSVAFDFNIFADESMSPDRGNDPDTLGSSRLFRLETFMESQYCIDEFWCWGSGVAEVQIPDREGNDPLRCTEIGGPLTLTADRPCSLGGVSPSENVSFTFNARLHIDGAIRGLNRLRPLTLTSAILDQPGRIPLLWDVDGRSSARLNRSAVFGAPPGEATFNTRSLWHPSFRHRRAMNVAFIDGSVETTRAPLLTDWRWYYTPGR